MLLTLDSHLSHNSFEMLEFTAENDALLLCLPTHTTHYLQPQRRSVFKSLKHFYKKASLTWIIRHLGRRVTRLQFGRLLSEAWCYAATSQNAIFEFKASGVCTFNPFAVPGYAFDLNITSQQSHADTAMEVESCLYPRIYVGMTNNPEPSRQEVSSSNQALNLPQESKADVTLPRISAGNLQKCLMLFRPFQDIRKPHQNDGNNMQNYSLNLITSIS